MWLVNCKAGYLNNARLVRMAHRNGISITYQRRLMCITLIKIENVCSYTNNIIRVSGCTLLHELYFVSLHFLSG